MDKNTITGIVLIFLIFVLWQYMTAPTAEQMAEQQRIQDSILLVQKEADSLASLQTVTTTEKAQPIPKVESDSAKDLRLDNVFGPFAGYAEGKEELTVLENDLVKLTFTSKGGRIKEALLKKYEKAKEVKEDDQVVEVKEPLILLEDEKNKFEYFLPIANLPSGGVKTGDLFFQIVKADANTIVYRVNTSKESYFEQSYTLKPNSYQLDYDVQLEGLQNTIAASADQIELNWVNFLDKLEINSKYERNYSSVYFKPSEEDSDHCSCTSNDIEEATSLKWVANANQFFTSALISDQLFKSGEMETQVLPETDEDLKRLDTKLQFAYGHSPSESYGMTFYIGPNEFDRLNAIGYNLTDVIPFGRSIFGSINRWVIRPIFNFLSNFIGSKGILILALTFLVKLVFYPLTYKMLYSQSKMGALKPQIEQMKGKFKDDPQKQQMETMKLYREFGVNPLGGCMPMVVQMPIWFALYRFFPASIEFRQASFLWANDLSSYDVFVRLPFEIPLGFGAHISLFTVLWAVTTLIYTYYNSKHMDMSANPAMKYMQYLMPVMFLGFFNSFASGLTCYLFFSNVINIGQTLVTKEVIIDKDKIREELEENRKKPKKKGGFQQRLEAALKEQQKIQAQREQAKKKRKKK